ncbi:MAG: hypothetical protein WD342_09890 [Verrucomicrobiales bacterium]
MNTLVIFKRFEIWLLLALVAALAVFALQPEETLEQAVETEPEPAKTLAENDANRTETPEAVEEPGLSVENVSVTGTKQGRIVELTLSGRSSTDEEIAVTESTLLAHTDAGDPVNHFFAPFQEPPVLYPDEDSLVTVRLWLEKPAESIWLDFQGRKVQTELPR